MSAVDWKILFDMLMQLREACSAGPALLTWCLHTILKQTFRANRYLNLDMALILNLPEPEKAYEAKVGVDMNLKLYPDLI